MRDLTICLQVLVATSILFVWVVRYENIVHEFQQYGLPNWLRDLVGILKLSFAALLFIGIREERFAVAAGIGIAVLMAAAVVTHIRMKNPFPKMVPSLCLMIASIVIAVINERLMTAGMMG